MQKRACEEATLRDLALDHEIEPNWLWVEVGVVGCEVLKNAFVCCVDVVCPRVVVDVDFLLAHHTLF